MSQSQILDVKGLHTYSSQVSGVPPGSLAVALNVDISKTNVVGPRPGFSFLTNALPSGTDRPKKFAFWNSEFFCHFGSTFAYYDESLGFLSRGSLSEPSNATKVRFVSSSNKNLYVTSSTGLLKTDAVATSLYAAGAPKGLVIDLAVAGAGTAVDDTKYVTYQYFLGRKDASGNTVTGGVSGRYTKQNTAGSTQNMTVTCFLPSGLSTSHFIQLYRSPAASSSATSEELQLCFEAPLSASDVSTKSVVITDIVPDELLGATIYTAPGQQGIANDNAEPPLARDIAEFKGCLFFADVESKHRFIFSLISVDGTGFVSGDTITLVLGAVTEVYTGGAVYAAGVGSGTFVVSTAGSPSQDIDATIKSFLKVVNQSSALVYAYSLSEGEASVPGKVLLETRSLGTASFTVTSSRSTAFQPQLPSPANVNNTSSNDQFRNGIMFSKPDQPEAVPLKNLFKVGSADDRILRIKAERDGLFIFKERDGAYVLRGENEANFAVTPLDKTARLVAPDSLEEVNNQIYGLFEAGICEVSDTGVSIISIPIKDALLPLFGAPLTNLKAMAFGIPADTDGKYILSVPTSEDDTATVLQIIFDVFGRTFCQWDFSLFCGGVNPANTKMYLGGGDTARIRTQRKNFDYTDFADQGVVSRITAYTGTQLTMTNADQLSPGDIIYQGDTALAYVESVESASSLVFIDTEQTWVLNTDDVHQEVGIDVRVQWNADFAGNAAGLKQYYELAVLQDQAFQKEATFYFSTDINPSEADIDVAFPSGNGAWGEFIWGAEVFGGEQAKAPKRIGIPNRHAICNQMSVRLEHRVAYSDFELTGISLSFQALSTSTSR